MNRLVFIAMIDTPEAPNIAGRGTFAIADTDGVRVSGLINSMEWENAVIDGMSRPYRTFESGGLERVAFGVQPTEHRADVRVRHTDPLDYAADVFGIASLEKRRELAKALQEIADRTLGHADPEEVGEQLGQDMQVIIDAAKALDPDGEGRP